MRTDRTPPVMERLVWTVEEAAQVLGISRTHAYELVARGELASVRLGRRIVVPKGPIDAPRATPAAS